MMIPRWDVINTTIGHEHPQCTLCGYKTDQMARFHMNVGYTWICSTCGQYVKDCMEKWKDLKPWHWINLD